MDVVDTLRHEEGQVARELKSDERDAAMVERLRQVYASQGIEVPDHILKAGVEDLKRDRFVYAPPSIGFQRTLAMVYISRGTWSKWLAAVVAVLVVCVAAWYFIVKLPAQRNEAELQARLEALPATYSELVARVDTLTDSADIETEAARLADDGRLALSDGNNDGAFKAEAGLRDLAAKLQEVFEVRIISREGIPTGVSRIPEANPETENYYILVEAIDPDGHVLEREIVSEENSATQRVDKWGQRVSETIYDAVRRDKMEDGIVQKGVLGQKRRGELEIKWRSGVQDGAITSCAGTLNTRLDSAAREARRLLEKRNSDYKVLSDQLRQSESERNQLQKQRSELDASRDTAENQMDELMEAVDSRLEKDTAYQNQHDRTEKALATAEAAASKARTSEQDRLQKGKAYEADPLFLYLWQRGYGTPDYQRRGLVRSLDRWVAGLIRFSDARANYAMLTSIPERVARHAERCAEIAREEHEKLAEFSRNAMTDAAGSDLVGIVEDLSGDIDHIDGELDTLDRRIETLAEALAEFSSGEDADFQKAEEHLAVSLQADDLNDLWRAALDTPSPEDEKIVQRIEDLRERVEQITREIRQDRELQRDIGRRRTELADVIKRFRSRGYGSWESTFSDDKLTTVLLGELVKGAITGAEYWSRAERSHKRRKPRGRQVAFPGGSGLPKSMGGIGGSRGRKSFGGGGFKSGGNFGGGGFKTGDRF
eukprot:g1845.t1